MNLDRYTLKVEQNSTIFLFDSIGPKGKITKLIQFEMIEDMGYYNLAFGDFNQTVGDINDLSVSDNGDTEKVLATVVAALFWFLDKYPEAVIYAEGSTKTRTRLYQMGIGKFHSEVKDLLHLFGKQNGRFVPFVPNEKYDAFLVRRK